MGENVTPFTPSESNIKIDNSIGRGRNSVAKKEKKPIHRQVKGDDREC
jgi:hypothetical protein